MARTIKTYPVETVEAAALKLEEFAQKGPRVLSVRMAIERLHPQIEALIAKGFSTEAIIMALRDCGISLSVPAFSEHWKSITQGAMKPSAKRSRKQAKGTIADTGRQEGIVRPPSAASTRRREDV